MADRRQVQIGDRRLSLSNLDKVLYPASGTTKGEVIDFYVRIAPALLPHLADRPVTVIRFPDGVDGQSFFAKNAPGHAPDWVRTVRLPAPRSSSTRGEVDYVVVSELATLVWLANLAALELHIPQWTVDTHGAAHSPDLLVIDLDPGPPAGLPACMRVATLLRDRLADDGITAFPKTSGRKGMQLLCPLSGGQPSNTVSAYAHALADQLARERPDLVVAQMAKALRPGKVLLDWSQNNAAKTTVAPYSLRAQREPTVSTPLTWDEVAAGESVSFGMQEALQRVEQRGDLMAALAEPGPPVPSADPLGHYRGKRDRRRTPEPVPEPGPLPAGDEDTFVIQQHHARRLHWDLRLERDGVLVSWAVPRGLPLEPGENRLAVHTEDHPLEYATFDGSIPRGEYGGGEVAIYDRGSYRTEKWTGDKVTVEFHGNRIRGRYALFATDDKNWLIRRLDPPDDPARVPMPTGLAPMLAVAQRTLPRPPERYGYEFDWGGRRTLSYVQGGRVRLVDEQDAALGTRPTGLPGLAEQLGARQAVLDGELADVEGTRLYVLYDLLHLDGQDLLDWPQERRRARLDELRLAGASWQTAPWFDTDGAAVLATARQRELPGVIAKRRDAPYRPGERSTAWKRVASH